VLVKQFRGAYRNQSGSAIRPTDNSHLSPWEGERNHLFIENGIEAQTTSFDTLSEEKREKKSRIGSSYRAKKTDSFLTVLKEGTAPATLKGLWKADDGRGRKYKKRREGGSSVERPAPRGKQGVEVRLSICLESFFLIAKIVMGRSGNFKKRRNWRQE